MRLGQVVIMVTPDWHNGANEHPAIVTRNWGSCVNVMVLPDAGTPYPMTSVRVHASRDAWFNAGSQYREGWVA